MNLSIWHRFGLIPGTLFLLAFLMVAAANAQTAMLMHKPPSRPPSTR